MELVQLLKTVEMFSGLTDDQLMKLAGIVEEKTYNKSQVVFAQGDKADRLFIVRDGFVEVVTEQADAPEGRTLVHLGAGQSVGEMALIDQGLRSASVRALSDGTVIDSISQVAFEQLCESDTAIGYRVMRNIAADISFKLRHQTLRGS